MKRRYESDINRIFSLIYEDEPIPPQVNARTEVPAPEYIWSGQAAYPDIKIKRKTHASSYLSHAGKAASFESRKKALIASTEIPEPKQISLDLNMLEGIRKAAGHTMEKLLTEEEMDPESLKEEQNTLTGNAEEFFSEPTATGFGKTEKAEHSALLPDGTDPAAKTEELFGLTGEEAVFLRSLLKNENDISCISKGLMLSVIVDSINEKLFDEFGDTVIENGASPEVIEDYREDLEKLFSE